MTSGVWNFKVSDKDEFAPVIQAVNGDDGWYVAVLFVAFPPGFIIP